MEDVYRQPAPRPLELLGVERPPEPARTRRDAPTRHDESDALAFAHEHHADGNGEDVNAVVTRQITAAVCAIVATGLGIVALLDP